MRRPILTLAPAILLIVIAPACSTRHVPTAAHRVGPADFATTTPRHGTAIPNDDVLDVNAPGRTPESESAPPAAGESESTVAPLPPKREVASETLAMQPGEPLLIDAKVGEIAGRPIYASMFFDVGTATQEPLGPRLAAEARRLSRTEWLAYARTEITQRLGMYIEDELLRAEAYSTLTPQQRQGLFAFVQGLQADLQRQAGGSREALKRQLEEKEGITADQWLRRQEQEILQRYELERKIFHGINIAWRDIEQAYYGRYRDIYQRPPLYRFYVMRLPADAATERDEFERALREGASFIELAARPSNRHTNAGGLEERTWRPEQAGVSLFVDPTLDAAAKSLGVGQTSGPITVGDNVWWIHLASIELPRSLYEAQVEIEQKLTNERRREALNRYLARLRDRASVTSVTEMGNRLLRIAVERYLPR